jgi:hypothetical protein
MRQEVCASPRRGKGVRREEGRLRCLGPENPGFSVFWTAGRGFAVIPGRGGRNLLVVEVVDWRRRRRKEEEERDLINDLKRPADSLSRGTDTGLQSPGGP